MKYEPCTSSIRPTNGSFLTVTFGKNKIITERKHTLQVPNLKPRLVTWRRPSASLLIWKAWGKPRNPIISHSRGRSVARTQSGKVTGVNQVNRTDNSTEKKIAWRARVMRDVDAWELRSGAAVTWFTCHSTMCSPHCKELFSAPLLTHSQSLSRLRSADVVSVDVFYFDWKADLPTKISVSERFSVYVHLGLFSVAT